MEQLWQLAMQQAAVTGERVIPDIAEDVIKEVLRNFSMKQWIAKDSYFLTKAEIAMDMELNPDDLVMPDEEGEMEMDVFMTMLAYNYNQPVSIVLPPEAEEAEEFPMLMQ